MSLTLAVAWLHGDDPQAAANAAGALVVMAAAATPMASLVDAWQREGELGVAAQIETMGMQGQLSWLPPAPMQHDVRLARRASAPGGTPGAAGRRHSRAYRAAASRGHPRRRPHGLHLLQAAEDGQRHPRPAEAEAPRAGIRRTGARCTRGGTSRFVSYIDWRQIHWIACVIEMFRQIKARAAILPPARPAKVTWSTGITSIEQGGACAGNTVVLHGTGFPSRTTTVLARSRPADGCRPVPVTAANWTSKKITFTLPGGVVERPRRLRRRGVHRRLRRLGGRAEPAGRRDPRARAASSARACRGCPRSASARLLTPVNRLQRGRADHRRVHGQRRRDGRRRARRRRVLWPGRCATRRSVRIDRISAAGRRSRAPPRWSTRRRARTCCPRRRTRRRPVYTYRLTVTGPCGTATRDVTVVVPHAAATSASQASR